MSVEQVSDDFLLAWIHEDTASVALVHLRQALEDLPSHLRCVPQRLETNLGLSRRSVGVLALVLDMMNDPIYIAVPEWAIAALVDVAWQVIQFGQQRKQLAVALDSLHKRRVGSRHVTLHLLLIRRHERAPQPADKPGEYPYDHCPGAPGLCT